MYQEPTLPAAKHGNPNCNTRTRTMGKNSRKIMMANDDNLLSPLKLYWEIFQEVVSETNKFRIQNFHKLFQFKKSHSYQTGLPLSADCFQFLGRKLRNLLPPTLPDICGMNETSLPGKILLQKPLVFKNSLAIHSQ